MRIAYYVHGRGRGHAMRSLPILAALRADGHELIVRAGGDAVGILAREPDFREIAAVVPGLRGTLRAPRRMALDVDTLRRFAPDVVVSDGDPTSLMAARARRLKTIAVGHSLVFRCGEMPADLAPDALARQRRGAALAHRLGDRIVAAHFLPTRCVEANARIARPVLRDGLREPADDAGAHIIAYFRDGNGANVVRALVARGLSVRCYGDESLAVRGAEARPFSLEGFTADLRSCRAIVGSSGSNLCAEAVALRKPMLALFRADDDEQRLNALLMERAGVAHAAALESQPDGVVERFAAAVDGDAFTSEDLSAALPDTVEAMRATLTEWTTGHPADTEGPAR